MPKNVFAVMGATGHVGEAIVDELIRHGHEVHAVGRDAAKLGALRTRGAKVFPAAFDNPASLAEAFHGAHAVFTMIPPGYEADEFAAFQDRVGLATVEAIGKAGVKHVMDLSSLGADLPQGTGPIAGLHRHEQRLNGMKDLHVLHLRPCYFMENLFAGVEGIRRNGVHGAMLRPDQPMHLVASHDVGVKAAELLEDRMDWEGHRSFEFVGPKMMTMHEVTAVLAKAIGRPDLRYMQMPYGEMEKAMVAAGMKPNTVLAMVEMHRAFNEGRIVPHEKITRDHQGKTTLEEFGRTFAHVFQKI